MMRSALGLGLLLLAASAAASGGVGAVISAGPSTSFPPGWCSPTPSVSGGWSPVNISDPLTEAKLYSYMLVSLEEWLPANTLTVGNKTVPLSDVLQCSVDELDATLDAGCSQIVAGVNYKVGYTLACSNSTEAAVRLTTAVFVPLVANAKEQSITIGFPEYHSATVEL